MIDTKGTNKTESLAAFVLLLSGMGTFFFSAIMNVFGLAVEGSLWSALLSSYTIILTVISVLLFLLESAKGLRFSRASMAFCGAIVVMCFGFMVTSQYAQGASRYFFLFLSTALPGFLAGLLLCNLKYRRHVWKYIDVFMLVFTASLAIYQTSADYPEDYAIDYQVASYMGALAFGLNLCMLLEGRRANRFRLFSNRVWQVVSIFLLVFQAIATIQTGGRGGVLLIALFSLFAVIVLIRRGIGVKELVYILLAVVAVLAATNYVLENQSQEGVARILSGRDNRSSVYDLAWSAFQDNPIFGYGPYGYLTAMRGIEYPHNIVLELLLTYGVVGIFFEVCLVVVLCLHIKKVGMASIPSWLVAIGIYAIVRLSFSSTMLAFSPFWFVIGFLSNYSSIPCEMQEEEHLAT